MQHSGMARPEYLLAKRHYLAYLRDAVIGPMDLDRLALFSVVSCVMRQGCAVELLHARADVWHGARLGGILLL